MTKTIFLVLVGTSIIAAVAPAAAKQDKVTTRGQSNDAAVYLPSPIPVAAPAYRWSLEAVDRASSPNAGGAAL
jgi:hypothetical protein